MKKYILTISSLLATAAFCTAQRAVDDIRSQDREAALNRRETTIQDMEHRLILVTHEKNIHGNFDFICENKAFCNYIVEVSFTDLQNLQPDIPVPIRITVPPGTRNIFTLRKTTLDRPIHFSFRYKVFKGCTNPVVDSAFTYLLPVAPGKETRATEVPSIAKKIDSLSRPNSWYALAFHVQSGDTVFAARSGRVTETLQQTGQQDTTASRPKGQNFIEIAHNDCSFANYRFFRDSSIFVHPGDWVEAGQPLGIAGGDKYAGGPKVQLSVYYNFEEVVVKDGQPPQTNHRWAYVPVQFWVAGKGKTRLTGQVAYTSEHPADLITQEMTQKEAKKWMASRKN
jgi:hypothetical protein